MSSRDGRSAKHPPRVGRSAGLRERGEGNQSWRNVVFASARALRDSPDEEQTRPTATSPVPSPAAASASGCDFTAVTDDPPNATFCVVSTFGLYHRYYVT